MSQVRLDDVRRKLIRLMRTDPPPAVMGTPREPLAPIFDRWVARRFSADEVNELFRLELEYGPEVTEQWFAEVLDESGLRALRRQAAARQLVA